MLSTVYRIFLSFSPVSHDASARLYPSVRVGPSPELYCLSEPLSPYSGPTPHYTANTNVVHILWADSKIARTSLNQLQYVQK